MNKIVLQVSSYSSYKTRDFQPRHPLTVIHSLYWAYIAMLPPIASFSTLRGFSHTIKKKKKNSAQSKGYLKYRVSTTKARFQCLGLKLRKRLYEPEFACQELSSPKTKGNISKASRKALMPSCLIAPSGFKLLNIVFGFEPQVLLAVHSGGGKRTWDPSLLKPHSSVFPASASAKRKYDSSNALSSTGERSIKKKKEVSLGTLAMPCQSLENILLSL